MPLPLHPQARILAQHPSGILALEKPAGLLTHPNQPGIAHNALLAAEYDPKAETYAWAEGKLHLNNRLDSPTSGIVLATLGKEMARAINELFRQKRVGKDYLALVKGIPTAKRGNWEDRIARGREKGRLRVAKGGGGIPARTTFELLKSSRTGHPIALLQLTPHTGRTHQLRVQAALHRLPIVGDRNYGDFGFNRQFQKATGQKRLFLHAHRIQLPVPGTDELFRAESPRPWEFDTVLSAGGGGRMNDE